MPVPLVLGLGFFLCPRPWPRALCPRLHFCIIHSSIQIIVDSVETQPPQFIQMKNRNIVLQRWLNQSLEQLSCLTFLTKRDSAKPQSCAVKVTYAWLKRRLN